MAFQWPATYSAPPTTCGTPAFVVNLASREAASASKSIKVATTRYTPNGHRVKAKLPHSPSPPTTQWSLDTPEQGTDDPPAALAPTPPPFAFGNSSPIATTSASQPTPSRGSTLNFTAAWNNNLELTLPESLPMSLSNNLLFNEVFKIQEIDRKFHPCRGLDAQGAQCKSRVPRSHSLSIKLVENSLGVGIQVGEIESLAIYNMCDAHTKQSAKLAKEWIRLAKLTRAARRFWLNQQMSLSVEDQALRKTYAEFAVAHVRGILAQDEIAVRAEKEKAELYDESQKTITWLRTKIGNIESEVFSAEGLNEPSKKNLTEYLDEIFALEKQINNLTTENSSLKEARDSTEDALAKERKRNQCDILDAKDLYEVSQKTIEVLRKEISALTSKVGELTTENSSLKEGKEETEDALVKERKRGQQDLQDAKGLYEGSQRIVEALRKEVDALNSSIGELTTENSSLKEDQEATEEALVKERKRGQQALQDAKGLYEGSQRIVEALRKEVDALNSSIGELTTKESSLKNSLESTQDALTKEKVRSRELEIRLEERVALGIKTQDSPETKLEKYLREELDKSQRHVLQQQKDFEKLRDDHVRLQITNATLESQVKQIEIAKEELSRASKREFQELIERNSDLSNQLHHTIAQFEQLKVGLAAMEMENEGEASKSKFSLRDIYRRPKREPSRLMTSPTDQ